MVIVVDGSSSTGEADPRQDIDASASGIDCSADGPCGPCPEFA